MHGDEVLLKRKLGSLSLLPVFASWSYEVSRWLFPYMLPCYRPRQLSQVFCKDNKKAD